MKSKNIILVSIGVILLWGLSWILTDYFLVTTGDNVIGDRGAFGDKFGFVNSLFSGLALAGIIISIYIQQKELKLQRDEIIETRQEFKDQNFQTTFFNLLKTQRQLGSEIYAEFPKMVTINDNMDYKKLIGRSFFIKAKEEMRAIKKIIEFKEYVMYGDIDDDWFHKEGIRGILNQIAVKNLLFKVIHYSISRNTWENAKKYSSLEIGGFSCSLIVKRYNFTIGHYFKHLYHIFNYLQETEKERLLKLKNEDNNSEKKEEVIREFKAFANFVQAQMITPELFLLFYHSLSYPEFQKILIYYKIFDNLTIEDLLSKDDNCIEGINLVSRDDKLQEMKGVMKE